MPAYSVKLLRYAGSDIDCTSGERLTVTAADPSEAILKYAQAVWGYGDYEVEAGEVYEVGLLPAPSYVRVEGITRSETKLELKDI